MPFHKLACAERLVLPIAPDARAHSNRSTVALLCKRIGHGGVDYWPVNTGWIGGQCGTAARMPIKVTHAAAPPGVFDA